MTPTLEERVTILEVKMEMVETNPQPGQNDAFSGSFLEVRADIKELRKDFKKFGQVQGQHTQTLTKLDSDVAEFKDEVKKKLKELGVVQDQHTSYLQQHARMLDDLLHMTGTAKTSLREFQVEVADFKSEVTGEITGLKSDVTGLKSDVTGLKSDVTGIRDNVTVLEVNMGEFKEEVAGRMNQIDSTLAEILDRLPAKAA